MNYVSVVFVHWAQNQYRLDLAFRSLDSLLESTEIPLEVIIVENGKDEFEFGKYCRLLLSERRIAHHISNGENLHFGYARNQGILLSTAPDLIAIVDNDIIYEKGWLEKCLEGLKKFKDRKLIASPLSYPRFPNRYLVEETKEWKFDMRAGSNCMVLPRKVFDEIGLFKCHRIAGSLFADKLVRAGYLTLVPKPDMAKDMGFKRGYHLGKERDHSKTLHNGIKVKVDKFPI